MPLTALMSLTHEEQQKLLKEGYVLAREIKDKPDRLKAIGISQDRFSAILEEAAQLSVTRRISEAPLI